MEKYTRIELRFFGKAVPFETYADYIQTADKDIGKMLSTLFFSSEKVREVASKRKISQDKIEAFLQKVELDGLHYAREAFNENRNFYRTIEPILKEAGKSLDISKRWSRKVREDIVGDFDIRAFFESQESSNTVP